MHEQAAQPPTPGADSLAEHQHIFFHPDCDRRLWHRTRSADPFFPPRSGKKGARGLVACATYRRWGISPRPEDVCQPEKASPGSLANTQDLASRLHDTAT